MQTFLGRNSDGSFDLTGVCQDRYQIVARFGREVQSLLWRGTTRGAAWAGAQCRSGLERAWSWRWDLGEPAKLGGAGEDLETFGAQC